MGIVTLHGAFAWDCPKCGQKNFEEAVEGCVPDELLDVAGEQLEEEGFESGDEDRDDRDDVALQFMADDPEMTEDGRMFETRVVITRMLLIPRIVQCIACKRRSSTTVATDEDDDEIETE